MTPETRRICGIGLVCAAVAGAAISRAPSPSPPPGPAPDIVLAGKFVPPLEDAAAVSAMWLEAADEIEWDGNQSEPLYTSGHSLDVFRTRARELRWRGQRIGDRQPAVQKAAHEYLDARVGVDGGPLTPEKRKAWVDAYRNLGRAAADAAR